ncbi:MAG: DUF192 domain-containing protein [Chloroflexi bacterium]|nr:DUF192 domain-containing protein [Chloroflexota bacterium]
MRRVQVLNSTRSAVLASRAEVARTIWQRGIGLLGRGDWSRADGLVITHCNSIHCLFMSLPIDVAFVRRDGRVARLAPDVRPWSIGPFVLSADYVVELPVGTLEQTGTKVNDQLQLVEAD